MTTGEGRPERAPVDRTEELLVAMLARRANRPMPERLHADTMLAVAASGRARGTGKGRAASPAGRSGLSDRFGPGTTIALTAVLLLGVVGGGLLASALLRSPGSPGSGQPGVTIVPSPSADASIDPASATEPAGASASPVPDPSPDPGAFLPDSLAIVTKAGNPLLVRSAPNTSDASKKLGTLASGTRMLVLSGPVAADGYDWYEVLGDGQPTRKYGWVARGPTDEPWLKLSAPKCWESFNASTIQALSRIDLLACYHDTEVTVQGHWRKLKPSEVEHPCDWPEVTGSCNAEQAWLLAPSVRITYEADDGTKGRVDVAVPDTLRARLEAVPAGTTLTATIAMDVPEARSCSVDDPEDGSVPRPADRAVAACRVRWALRDIASNEGGIQANGVARVVADRLAVRIAPDTAARTAGRSLRAGDRVYVVEGPRTVGGTDWFAVLWQDRDTVFGWVPARQSGRRTLVPRSPACAGLADWAAFKELEWWERLACLGDRTVSADMWLHLAPPQPERSLACGYWALKATTGRGDRPGVADASCQATPTWLAGVTGLVGRRRGGIEAMLAYDPTTVDVSSLGAGSTWVRVTGSFMHPAASQCRVLDQVTGLDLVPPEEAATYCRGVFVVTGIGAAAGPEPK